MPRKGDVVVMDDLAVHKARGALGPICARGAAALFLPPRDPGRSPTGL
jgi:hypothetical protein